MNETLAVKYRPKEFEQVIGQPYVVEVLQNQIQRGDLGKAYLYTGPSGVGKTTVARIFSDKIDGEVIEIDAASHNGVENVRSINKNVAYKPLNNQYKVYIIDECHMLSKSAWNALLKTLEEPPAHAIFILATTEPHKVIPTIISRSQRLNFVKPKVEDIAKNLKHIVESEGREVDYEVLRYIAKLADGGVRLSITMLQSCLNYEVELTVPKVEEILGHIPTSYFIDLIWNLTIGDQNKIFEIIDNYKHEGIDFERYIENLVMFTLDLQKYVATRDMRLLRTSSMYEDDIRAILNNIVNLKDGDIGKLQADLNHMHNRVRQLYYDSKNLQPKQYLLESTLIEMTFNKE